MPAKSWSARKYGIDLRFAAAHRSNLPQIRITPDDAEMTELARAFGAPAIIHAPVREGSLRQFAITNGVRVLLFESGEALRFDEIAEDVRGDPLFDKDELI
ncbi:MAG: hypothetical protein ACE5ED_01125 [Rhodothalassiaceae bacterium]